MNEWSEHKIKAIFERNTLGNPTIDSLFISLIFRSHLPNWEDNSLLVVSVGGSIRLCETGMCAV